MVTMDEVLGYIQPEEPNYPRAAAKLGTEAVPHLAELAAGDDVMLAAKAVSLAGLIGGDEALELVTRAAQADEPEVRIVAASAAARLGAPAEPVIEELLGDGDRGVRKYAVRAVPDEPSAALRQRLESLRDTDGDAGVREQIQRKLSPGG